MSQAAGCCGGTSGAIVWRSALVDFACSSESPFVLLAAPSGYGKSILASQIASQYRLHETVDLEGEPFSADATIAALFRLLDAENVPTGDSGGSLAARACAALATSPSGAAGSCLVIDGLEGDHAEGVLDDLWSLAQILAQSHCRLVVCLRCVELPAVAVMRLVEGIGADEMRFTLHEAELLRDQMVHDSTTESEVQPLWEACDGHAALLALMMRDVSAGLGSSPEAEWSSPRLMAQVSHSMDVALGESDTRLLYVASLLQTGSIRSLEECGLDSASPEDLRRISLAMPLFRVSEQSALGVARFSVHALLSNHLKEQLTLRRYTLGDLGQLVVEQLVDAGRVVRAAEVARLVADDDSVRSFLASHAERLVELHAARQLCALLDRVPLARIMGDARLLLAWSDALLDIDDFTEALARARAGRLLAEHAGELDLFQHGLANSIDALRLLNRWDEALALVPAGHLSSDVPPSRSSASLHFAIGRLLASVGQFDQARRSLSLAQDCCHSEGTAVQLLQEQASAISAVIPAVAEGDFVTTIRALSVSVSASADPGSRNAASQGNLAASLLETGRVSRSRALALAAISNGGPSATTHFMPVAGCSHFAEGREQLGLETLAQGIRRALESGSEVEAAQNRVFEAMLLRASGRVEESLTSAERAYERLCVQDYMEFRRLAALEVAASLLALGDTTAARAWAEPVVSAGFRDNRHHAFRGAMVLAECDRADGDVEAGIARLAQHAEHIRSENSNFQAAIYSRAFPDLMAMIAAAVGVSDLPVHMLRMVLPENAERTLRVSRTYLDGAEWALLGERLLGKDQFDAFVERKGRPICRVRMFGGLEVTVGDRTVHERDWRKRKARTLFVMLVLGRGQEIPRDQLLDHVWPDLPEDRAKNNFYVAWSTMKGALMGPAGKAGPCPYIDGTAGRCRIVRDAVRSDVDEFEELLAAGREGEASGKPEQAIAAYERLSSTYRGELLPGDLYDDWFAPLRDRYRFDFIASMLRLVDLYLDRDDPCNALVYAHRALNVDPTREDLYQATLRCQISAGQRSAAVETFVQCKTQLAEELGLDPSAETIALYQQILVMEDHPRYDDFGVKG